MKSKTILIAVVLLIWGCGSNSNQCSPASKAAKKSSQEVKDKAQVSAARLLEEGSKLIEATPPTKPGGFGMTVGEVQARQALNDKAGKNLGPVEVTPPIKPGEHGMSVDQLQAIQARNPTEKLDPSKIEVVPPSHPGKKGPTVMELERLQAAQAREPVNPDDIEVVPPGKPGEKGMTVGQLKAIQAKYPRIKPEYIPPVPGTPPPPATLNKSKIKPEDIPPPPSERNH